MDYFKLPDNYACIQKNSSQIYAYSQDYRTRDTFELDNFLWLKVASSSNNYAYTPGTCLPSDVDYLIPDSLAGSFVIAAALAAAILVAGLFKVFSR